MNYPYNRTWLVMIASRCFMVSLSRHFGPFKATFMSAAALRTLGGCDILRSAFSLFPLSYIYFLLSLSPFTGTALQKQFALKAKSSSAEASSCAVSVPFPLVYRSLRSSAKALCWYWLKHCLLVSCQHFPAACCELKGNTDTEWRGEKVVAKSRGQRKWARGLLLPSSQSGEAFSLPPKAKCLE